MSKITLSKMMRRMYTNVGTKDKPVAGAFVGYAKPQNITEKIVDLPRGAKMRVRVAPGQVLNIKKEFERAKKRGDIIYPENLNLK